MNTKTCLNGNFIKRFIAALLVAFIFVAFFSRIVMADTGPKRSIDVKIINAPAEPYFVALVMPTEYVADINDKHRYDHIPEDHDWIREIFYEYNEDGFRLFTYAGGTNSIKYSEYPGDFYKGENTISYGYMVPSTFKVMIVTESGEVTVSNEITAPEAEIVCGNGILLAVRSAL